MAVSPLKSDGITLEVRCDSCQGSGGEQMGGKWSPCFVCDGAGYLPTDLGNKVLEIVRHNLPSLLKRAQPDSDS